MIDSITYDPAKTILLESEAEVEESTNHNAGSQALRVQSDTKKLLATHTI